MKSNDIINLVRSVVDYIEDNITENITLDDISSYSYFSKFYLSRIFKLVTDKSLIEYVRQRKLAKSANDLVHSGYSINSIACKYSFSYPSTYIHAFKNTYGVTPKKFLTTKAPIASIEKLDSNKLESLINSNSTQFD